MRADFVNRAGRAWRPLIGAAMVSLALCGGPAWGLPDETEVAETLRRSVEQLRSTGEATIAGRRLLSARALPEIYETRGFRRLWNDPVNEEALLGEIAAASGDGLHPSDYHFDAIRAALERRKQAPDSATTAATVDLLLTDALLRLAAHLHFGKLDAATGQPRWDLDGMIRGEPAATVVTRIAVGSAVAPQLGELRPVQPLYGRFKSALARYRVIEEEGGWERLPGGRVLEVGMDDPRVRILRRRLVQTGDFPGIALDSARFEPALADAVRRFQARHQLTADSLIGPATLAALNRPVEELIGQLRVNLERARWLLSEVRGQFLLVDPAGDRVLLMDNSRLVLVQGASFAAATRSVDTFRAELRYLVVHPDLVLPPRLVEAQVAPLARRDPAQLEARGLQVFNAAAEPVDAARANWSRPTALVVRQLPGPRSFLGTLRFAMPNADQVFLHGGPAEGEALPGSIRLEAPEALAVALSGPPSSWSGESLAAALAAGIPRTLPLGRSIPVLFGPWSAWVDADGTVSFRRGYEQQDAAIIAGLERGTGR